MVLLVSQMSKRGFVRTANIRKAGGGVTWHICSADGIPKCASGKKSYNAGKLSEVVWSEKAPGILCKRCVYR